ncbi:MAG: Geranylgeranyl reductase [archaeon GW2011_AR20]|nr:MAG: Geranylgeranyl reductase [archaeon GW2011_AR20]
MIAIIGGGPSGSYLASLLAKEEDVTIFEEHPEIGNPIQCTGILSSSSSALQVKIPEEIIVNKIKKIELISPDNNSITFNLKEPDLITNRMELDRFLANEAVNNGAKIELNHRFVNYENGKISVRHKGELKNYNVGALIGADGPNSQVAKSVNLYGERKFWVARQCRVKIKNDPELFKVYFGSQISNDFFGWVVPENENIARVGIGAGKKAEFYFKSFLNKLGNPEIIDYQAGLIPIYDPKPRRSNDNVYLIGDSALQVKAISGGGIIKGMLAAEELSKAILKNLDYEKLWRKKIGFDLWLNLKIRQMLNNFDDGDYNKLISFANENSLSSFNREFPKKTLLNSLIKNPELGFFLFWKFAKVLYSR